MPPPLARSPGSRCSSSAHGGAVLAGADGRRERCSSRSRSGPCIRRRPCGHLVLRGRPFWLCPLTVEERTASRQCPCARVPRAPRHRLPKASLRTRAGRDGAASPERSAGPTRAWKGGLTRSSAASPAPRSPAAVSPQGRSSCHRPIA